MDLANIEKLVEKYLEAETSIQEEALLKNYFNSDKVAPHLKEYQSMFSYFSQSKEENFSQELRLKPRNTRRMWFTGLAAGFALLIGGMFFQNYQEQRQAEQALADTKMAFQLIAKQLDKGNKAVKELGTVETVTTKAFGNQLSIAK